MQTSRSAAGLVYLTVGPVFALLCMCDCIVKGWIGTADGMSCLYSYSVMILLATSGIAAGPVWRKLSQDCYIFKVLATQQLTGNSPALAGFFGMCFLMLFTWLLRGAAPHYYSK